MRPFWNREPRIIVRKHRGTSPPEIPPPVANVANPTPRRRVRFPDLPILYPTRWIRNSAPWRFLTRQDSVSDFHSTHVVGPHTLEFGITDPNGQRWEEGSMFVPLPSVTCNSRMVWRKALLLGRKWKAAARERLRIKRGLAEREQRG